MEGKEIYVKDEETKGQISGAVLSLLAVCIIAGFGMGDVVAGLGSAIAYSLVLGLRTKKLWTDERTSAIFSKASRNAFVVVNLAFPWVVFWDKITFRNPFLNQLSYRALFFVVMVFSWVVFLMSWLYHNYLIGE